MYYPKLVTCEEVKILYSLKKKKEEGQRECVCILQTIFFSDDIYRTT